MSGNPPIFAVGFSPNTFSGNSGLWPIVRILNARRIEFQNIWYKLQQKSWTAGSWLQRWGVSHYGSAWNSLAPYWAERQILRQLPVSDSLYPVHFLWGEFGAPKSMKPYHRKGARVVVGIHCSAQRRDSVWLRPDGYANADQVLLTSESQRPFVARYVPENRISVILHGVLSGHYVPGSRKIKRDARFRMWLMGNTERDHDLVEAIARKLPANRFELRIRVPVRWSKQHENIPCVTILPRLSDAEMLAEYQQADLLLMPMLDSAANNVLLESMSCGTPVMVNHVGGVPEYVSPDCNFLMNNDRNVDEWVEKLLWMEENRDEVERMRPATRAWAERFDWTIIAEEYKAMYRQVLARG